MKTKGLTQLNVQITGTVQECLFQNKVLWKLNEILQPGCLLPGSNLEALIIAAKYVLEEAKAYPYYIDPDEL